MSTDDGNGGMWQLRLAVFIAVMTAVIVVGTALRVPLPFILGAGLALGAVGAASIE